jgi:phosphatidylglycerophosphate synthase
MLRLYRRYHPHDRFGPANVVTTIRAVLTLVLAWYATQPASGHVATVTAWTAGLVASLDGVDGYCARKTKMSSAFGARFDMETDAALLMVLSVLVWRQERAGAWVLFVGLMRYLFVAAGWLMAWLAGPLTPTFRGKTVAVVEMVALALALLLPRDLAAPLCAFALMLLVWSFAIDVGRLWSADDR